MNANPFSDYVIPAREKEREQYSLHLKKDTIAILKWLLIKFDVQNNLASIITNFPLNETSVQLR